MRSTEATSAAAVLIGKRTLIIDEEDTPGATYTVKLGKAPSGDVAVTVGGTMGTDVTATPASLTFATSHWSTAQTVTVRAGSPEVARGQFLYSNVFYVMAGAMAEGLAGKTREAQMEERLFKPLGMTRAGFRAPGAAHRLDQPWGHRRSGDGGWRARQFDNPRFMGPAGTVPLPIEGYAWFLKIWYRGTAPVILDRDTLDRLKTPHAGNYAAGWRVYNRSWGGGTVITYGGSDTYRYVTVWLAPKFGRAYLAVANSAERGTRRMLDGIIGKLIGH